MSEESLQHLRLGRLASRPEDRKRTLKLTDYLPTLQAPPSANVAPAITSWPMYANDRLGDCTCAASGHMVGVWTQQVDGSPRIFADSDIEGLYALVNGGQDAGADMLTVLGAWRKQGLAGDRILAYVEVDHTLSAMVKAACWYFSGLYVGVNLPRSAQAQLAAGQPWDAVATPDGAPGSWGGHAINITAYDRWGLTCVTWGKAQRLTWDFWKKYVDESYAVLPSDYDRLQGKALENGFKEDDLKADLAQFGTPTQ